MRCPACGQQELLAHNFRTVFNVKDAAIRVGHGGQTKTGLTCNSELAVVDAPGVQSTELLVVRRHAAVLAAGQLPQLDAGGC